VTLQSLYIYNVISQNGETASCSTRCYRMLKHSAADFQVAPLPPRSCTRYLHHGIKVYTGVLCPSWVGGPGGQTELGRPVAAWGGKELGVRPRGRFGPGLPVAAWEVWSRDFEAPRSSRIGEACGSLRRIVAV